MVTLGITKAITNLREAHAKLGLAPNADANFFREWRDHDPLPPLTVAEQAQLDHLKQRYLHYADSGAITEGTVNLILLSPLLDLLGLFDPPYTVRGEKYVRFEIEDGETILDGLIDALVIGAQLWLIVIESKRYGFSVRQAIAQTLAYMMANPSPSATDPTFALITTGEDYLFVKLDRRSRQYALSDKLTLTTAEGNALYPVAQILKRLTASGGTAEP